MSTHRIQITEITAASDDAQKAVTERTVFVAEFDSLNISKIVRALYAETRSKRAKSKDAKS